MGAGASTDTQQFSNKFLQVRIEDLRERELSGTEEGIKKESERQERVDEEIQRLRSERDDLLEKLREKELVLNQTVLSLNKEKDASVSLMLSELPLKLLKETSSKTRADHLSKTRGNLASSFPLVSVLSSNIVGFSTLCGKLAPRDLIGLIDRLHAIVDDALSDPSIFIMDRDSDVCTAVCGIETSTNKQVNHQTTSTQINSAHVRHSSTLAIGALKLMSSSSRITIPSTVGEEEGGSYHSQLQLRVSLHSGPCAGGIIGLQQTSSSSSHHVLKYRLFGATFEHAKTLSSTGLALQIRVSEACRTLLVKAGGFIMERCPDYGNHVDGHTPIVSYWLLGRDDLDLPMPSSEHALPLPLYDSII
jgi:class 3 adenylate cyclase